MMKYTPYKSFLDQIKNTCKNQKPIVAVGQKVRKHQVIADGSSTKNGELSLGKNILVRIFALGRL